MDLRTSLETLRRSWLLVAAPTVVGLVLATGLLSLQTPKYESTAKVYVSIGNAANANDLSQGNSFAQAAAVNFASLAQQPYVLQAVRDQLALPLTADQIAAELTTSVEPNTSIISLTVLDPSALRAASIANTVALQLSTAVTTLNPVTAAATGAVKVTVVRAASTPQRPALPNWPMGIALGLLGGLLLGLVLVILRELLDTRIHSAEELQELTGVPTAGSIPRDGGIGDRPLAMIDDRRGPAAEGFRSLQLNLEYLRAQGDVAIVAVSSALPSEGKSTVAANLAIALAAAGQRVALVDADLRQPRLHDLLGLDNGLGLTEVLVGRASVAQAVQTWGIEAPLTVLPAGAAPPNPSELLQSHRLREALEQLSRDVDVVIVDGPPLLAVADAAIVARTADAVLLVASLRRSHRGQVQRAVASLRNVGARLLGGVATMTAENRADADGYSHYNRPSAVTARPRAASAQPRMAGALRRMKGVFQPGAGVLTRTKGVLTRVGSTARDLMPRPAPAPSARSGKLEHGLLSRAAVKSARASNDPQPVAPTSDEGIESIVTATSVVSVPIAVIPADTVLLPEPITTEPAEPAEPAAAALIEPSAAVPDVDARDSGEPEQTAARPRRGAAAARPARKRAAGRSGAGRTAGGEPDPDAAPEPTRAGSPGAPLRLPAVEEADDRTLRSAKRRLSEEELRILRGFTSRNGG